MKRWILAAAFLAVASAAQADDGLTPFKATYAGSVSIGSLACQMTLRRNPDGSYSYQWRSHAVGFASLFFKDVITEVSRFEMVGGRPRPLEYRYTRTGGKHEKSEIIEFDWKKDTARTEENGQTKYTALSSGVADRLLTQLILSLDAASGKLQDKYEVLDHRDVSSFSPAAPEHQTVRVPAGEYDTVMVERHDKGSKRTMDFWFAPELHYLPAQIQQREQGEDTYTLSLVSSSFGAEASTGK